MHCNLQPRLQYVKLIEAIDIVYPIYYIYNQTGELGEFKLHLMLCRFLFIGNTDH